MSQIPHARLLLSLLFSLKHIVLSHTKFQINGWQILVSNPWKISKKNFSPPPNRVKEEKEKKRKAVTKLFALQAKAISFMELLRHIKVCNKTCWTKSSLSYFQEVKIWKQMKLLWWLS